MRGLGIVCYCVVHNSPIPNPSFRLSRLYSFTFKQSRRVKIEWISLAGIEITSVYLRIDAADSKRALFNISCMFNISSSVIP